MRVSAGEELDRPEFATKHSSCLRSRVHMRPGADSLQPPSRQSSRFLRVPLRKVFGRALAGCPLSACDQDFFSYGIARNIPAVFRRYFGASSARHQPSRVDLGRHRAGGVVPIWVGATSNDTLLGRNAEAALAHPGVSFRLASLHGSHNMCSVASVPRQVAAGASGNVQVGHGNILWVPEASKKEAKAAEGFSTSCRLPRAGLCIWRPSLTRAFPALRRGLKAKKET